MNRWTGTVIAVMALSAFLYRGESTAPASSALQGAAPAAESEQAQSRQAARTTSPNSSTSPSNPCTNAEENPMKALASALGFVGPPPLVSADQAYVLEDANSQASLKTSTALIVTVPDPVHSHLALWFDRSVDAIILAAQQSGYNRDYSFWLPWSSKPPDPQPDCSYLVRRNLELERRSQEPGVLVFRGPDNNDAAPRKLLLVFLVAETPTWGINKMEFTRAVDDLFRWGRCSDHASCRVPVAGPAFSGSAPSFMEAISQSHQRHQNTRFAILSGSVTGTDAVEDLFQQCGKLPQRACVEAQTTLWDDDTREGYLFHFLQWGHFFTSRVALVTESGTGYGVMQSLDGRWRARWAISPERFIQLQFPRGISHLREAYDQNPQIWAPPGSQASGTPGQYLPLNLKESPALGEDQPPAFSEAQTPLSQEMEMASLARELKDENIDGAVIQATDPLDVLFLIRFLQRTNPGVQLIVLDPDLLFLRALGEQPPLGLLAVSSYPLFLRNQYWTAAETTQRVLFPDEYSEALYNACVTLLRHGDKALEQRVPDPFTRGRKPSSHQTVVWGWLPGSKLGGVQRGPVWLTMVGRNGYWPITILNKTWNSSVSSGREPMPFLWKAVWLGLIVLSFIYPILLLLANCSERIWLRRLRLAGCTEQQVSPRAMYLFLGALLLLLGHALVSLPTWRVYDAGPLGVVDLVGVLCLLAAVAWLIIRLFSDLKVRLAAVTPDKRKPRLTMAPAFTYVFWSVVALAASAIFSLYWWRNVGARSYYAYFLSYRSARLVSGVSPALPLLLLLAAFGFLAWTRLSSLVLLGIRPALPELTGALRLAPSAERADRAFQDVVYDGGWQLILVGVFVLILALFAPRPSTISIEAPTFNDAFLIGLVAFCSLVLSNCWRLLYVWHLHLKPVLHKLERHPLREAFSRLPKQYSCPPLWKLSSVLWAQKLMAPSINCLRRFVAQTQDASLKAEEVALVARARQIGENIENGRCTPQSEILELQSMLGTLSEQLQRDYLASEWERGYSDSLSAEEAANRTNKTRERAFESRDRTIVAEEFVAFRYVDYIRYTCAQLTYIVFSLVVAFALGLLAVASYPFEVHRGMDEVMIVMFVAVGIVVVELFAEMEKDSVLSRLSETAPGKLSWEFYFRVAAFGALPLLTLVASHFPFIGNFFFSWIQPGLQAMK